MVSFVYLETDNTLQPGPGMPQMQQQRPQFRHPLPPDVRPQSPGVMVRGMAPGMAPGMTPGMTPGMAPNIQVSDFAVTATVYTLEIN